VLGIALLLGVVVLWALVARRLESFSVTMAVAIVVVAILLTSGGDPAIRIELDTRVTERVVEVALAILLFVDASEVPASIIASERTVLTRLLMIAVPLSLIVAWVVGLVVFPGRNAWLLVVLAAIVVPLDLAPAPSLVRDRRIPRRLRDVLNLESGFNDGLVAAAFLFAVGGASAHGTAELSALMHAIPAIAIATGIGAAVGVGGAVALSRSWRRGWTGAASLRVGVLALPLLTYVLAVASGGNGFVAAFVAGIVFALCRHQLPLESLQLTEDTLLLLSLVIWFLFGDAVRQALAAGLRLDVILYAVLALTVARTVPVMLSLHGTDIPRAHALFLGLMGPRGLASMVFGLLAVIELKGGASTLAEQVMVVTVLLSVILHGAGTRPIAARFARGGPDSPAPTEPMPQGTGGVAPKGLGT